MGTPRGLAGCPQTDMHAARHTLRWTAVALAAAALAVTPLVGEAEGHGFKIVVNEDCPAPSLTRDQISRLFLGRAAEWPGGLHALPVDQREGSPVREAFTRAIHRRSVSAVKLLWQQAIFSGRGLPPPEASGDAAVPAHVMSQPEAIGYVSATSPTDGVVVATPGE
jgi:ABC-type phosphate transport system substrate-binding protein